MFIVWAIHSPLYVEPFSFHPLRFFPSFQLAEQYEDLFSTLVSTLYNDLQKEIEWDLVITECGKPYYVIHRFNTETNRYEYNPHLLSILHRLRKGEVEGYNEDRGEKYLIFKRGFIPFENHAITEEHLFDIRKMNEDHKLLLNCMANFNVS